MAAELVRMHIIFKKLTRVIFLGRNPFKTLIQWQKINYSTVFAIGNECPAICWAFFHKYCSGCHGYKTRIAPSSNATLQDFAAGKCLQLHGLQHRWFEENYDRYRITNKQLVNKNIAANEIKCSKTFIKTD